MGLNTNTYTTPGTFTWTAPATVTGTALAEIWCGGGDSEGTAGLVGSGGGHGGSYAKRVFTPVAGRVYTIKVGTSEAANTSGSEPPISRVSSVEDGPICEPLTSDVTFDGSLGGAGADLGTTGYGGGGGAGGSRSGSPASPGDDGADGAAGATPASADGGSGGSGSDEGYPSGQFPGGGAGGAFADGTPRGGNTGATGQVVLTFTTLNVSGGFNGSILLRGAG